MSRDSGTDIKPLNRDIDIGGYDEKYLKAK